VSAVGGSRSGGLTCKIMRSLVAVWSKLVTFKVINNCPPTTKRPAHPRRRRHRPREAGAASWHRLWHPIIRDCGDRELSGSAVHVAERGAGHTTVSARCLKRRRIGQTINRATATWTARNRPRAIRTRACSWSYSLSSDPTVQRFCNGQCNQSHRIVDSSNGSKCSKS
jgi:hypothetical protein